MDLLEHKTIFLFNPDVTIIAIKLWKVNNFSIDCIVLLTFILFMYWVGTKITYNFGSHFLMFRKFAQLNVVKTHAIGTSQCAYYITRG